MHGWADLEDAGADGAGVGLGEARGVGQDRDVDRVGGRDGEEGVVGREDDLADLLVDFGPEDLGDWSVDVMHAV